MPQTVDKMVTMETCIPSLDLIKANIVVSVPWYEMLPLLAIRICMQSSFSTSGTPDLVHFAFSSYLL